MIKRETLSLSILYHTPPHPRPVLPAFQWGPGTLQQQSSCNLSSQSLGCICQLVALFSLCKHDLAVTTNFQPPHGEPEYLSEALAPS